MKRMIKSIAGVTLLEIMLVLAIAAMVITMSVKYYATANNSAHLNSAVEQVQSIAAAADGIAQTTGGYGSAITSTSLASVLPVNWQFLPWGAKITVVGTGASMSISVPTVPGSICSQFIVRVISNVHFATSSSCGTGTTPASVTFTYTP